VKHDDLVIDVGLHRGEDTRFYLAKGFRCVAIEANPVLVEQAKRDFADELADGRLRIFGVAIAERAGTVDLAVSDEATDWSSLCPGFVSRNEALSSTRYRTVEVPAMRFEDILTEVGIPRYLKIDIEGLDMLCVRALHAFDERPEFISVESAVSSLDAPLKNVFDELAELWALGYRKFAYVNQNGHPFRRAPYPPREGRHVDTPLTFVQSGYFGEEMPERWSSIWPTLLRARAIRVHHNLCGYGGVWTRNPITRPYAWLANIGWHLRHPSSRAGYRAWWDLHARLG
jgi:FkbM family methyltransferase